MFYYHSQVLSELLSKLSPTRFSLPTHVHLNPESKDKESPYLGVAVARVETDQAYVS